MQNIKTVFRLMPFLSLFLGACAFKTDRSFLSEMEHDDSGFFSPNQDFQVMGGDTGRHWMTESERMDRTPTSTEDLAELRIKRSLEDELRSLERQQSESATTLYNKYRHRFSTTSEKIYFLKLAHHERKDYLEAKGFMEQERPYVHRSNMVPNGRTQLILGMSKHEVIGNLGRPVRVEISGNPNYENERWVYRTDSAMKYIYFEGGRVGGWE